MAFVPLRRTTFPGFVTEVAVAIRATEQVDTWDLISCTVARKVVMPAVAQPPSSHSSAASQALDRQKAAIPGG